MSFIQPGETISVGWAAVIALVSYLFGTAIGCWITFILLRVFLKVQV